MEGQFSEVVFLKYLPAQRCKIELDKHQLVASACVVVTVEMLVVRQVSN